MPQCRGTEAQMNTFVELMMANGWLSNCSDPADPASQPGHNGLTTQGFAAAWVVEMFWVATNVCSPPGVCGDHIVNTQSACASLAYLHLDMQGSIVVFCRVYLFWHKGPPGTCAGGSRSTCCLGIQLQHVVPGLLLYANCCRLRT